MTDEQISKFPALEEEEKKKDEKKGDTGETG